MRLLRRLVPLLLAVAVHADDEKPADEAPTELPPGEVVIPDPGAPVEDKDVARQQVDRFVEGMKAAKDTAEQVALLERLGGWDHPEILKAAAKFLRDRDTPVAVAAVIACARQSQSAGKAGGLLWRALGSEKRTEVVCALIVGLGRVKYDSKSAQKVIEKIFRKDTTEPHKAAARYFGYIQAKWAFRMLAEKLEEPKNNLKVGETARPMSYWKGLWDEWKSALPTIRWALSQLVPGETFETLDEARSWAESEGKEHGIEW